MFYVLQNLSSMSVSPVQEPWALGTEVPSTLASKEEYKRWSLDPATRHAFASAFEGLAPAVRIGKDNPPVRMHGLIVDYDSRSVTADRIRELAARPPCEFVPAYGSVSYSGGGRLYWLFEKPLPVSQGTYLKKFMERLLKDLCVVKWLPGADAGATANPGQYYEIGKEFVPLGGRPIPHGVLSFMAWEAMRDTPLWAEAKDFEIPMDAIAAEVEERFPGRWRGAFEIGARGVRFWDPAADNPTGAQVRADGVTCYTGDKAFMSWKDIFGYPFVAKYGSSKSKIIVDNTYFDGQKYFLRLSDEESGGFAEWNKDDFAKFLRHKGFSSTRKKGETSSEVDDAEVSIQIHRKVDYAKRLIHYRKGLLVWHGKKFLNMGAPTPMQPAPQMDRPMEWSDGTKYFPLIKAFSDILFADKDGKDEYNQLVHSFAWLKRFYKSGLDCRPTRGQVVFIAGPVGKGKSLFCEGIVGGLMGGCEEGTDHFVDGGHWTDNIAQAPVVYVGDALAVVAKRTRDAFSNLLKKYAANASMRSSQKFSKEADVPWYGRIMISLNMDAESLEILPNMDISNRDKISLFKTSDAKFPFPPEDEIEEILKKELPFFGRFLLDWTPPPNVMSSEHRFGVEPFHHPELYDEAAQRGGSGILNEFLLNFLAADKLANGTKRNYWRGTLVDLYSNMVQMNPQVASEFRSIKTFQTYLAHVKNRGLIRMDKTLRKHGGLRTWMIYYPTDESLPEEVKQ